MTAISIYHQAKKCFGFSTVLSAVVLLMLLNACKTNRTEVASSRLLFSAKPDEFDSWEIIPGKNTDLDAYKMLRKDNQWMISVNGGEPAQPDTAYLRRSIQHLTNLQAVTELNVPRKNWDTLQVTDKDARLIIYKNGKKLQEIILGKMFFGKNNKTTYYLRLKDEDKIYTVQQYLEGSFKVPTSKLRKKEMVNLHPAQIAEILFLKPEGIDFTMLRAGQTAWSIDGILTNDSIANNFVAILNALNITKFGETPTTGADLSIQLTTYGGQQVSLRAFRKNSDIWVLSSSSNTGNYMELNQSQIQAIFPGKSYFLQNAGK